MTIIRAKEIWGGLYGGEIVWQVFIPAGGDPSSLQPDTPVLYTKANVWCQEEYNPAVAAGWEEDERPTTWAQLSNKGFNYDPATCGVEAISSSYPV